MEKEFKILLSSDLSYEYLIAEIYYGEELIAIIDREDGPENLNLQLFGASQKEARGLRVNFYKYLEVIEKAKKRLLCE